MKGETLQERRGDEKGGGGEEQEKGREGGLPPCPPGPSRFPPALPLISQFKLEAAYRMG